MPLAVCQFIAKMRVKFWYFAYLLALDAGMPNWFVDWTNMRRCYFIRSWYANESKDYARFCAAIRFLKCRDNGKKKAPDGNTIKEKTTERTRPLTPQEREWLRKMPKYDRNGDPYAQMARFAKYMDEGMKLEGI